MRLHFFLIAIAFAAIEFNSPGFVQSVSADDGTSVTADGASVQLLAEDFIFTEGPAADAAGNVYFTDQPNDRIMRWSIEGKMETWMQPAGRSNGLFFDNDGSLIACADGKNELWRIQADKSHEVLLADFEGKLFNGPNDAWVAADDSIYFTDPFYKRPYWERDDTNSQLPQRVYRYIPGEKTVAVVADQFVQPNGIVGNKEQKIVYIADIGDKKTYRYDIADDGSLVNRTLFCELGSDGMTLDTAGNLYLTGKGVTVFNSEGKQIQQIDVPENWTANVCFGGPERKTLFITASDSFYSIEMRVAGL